MPIETGYDDDYPTCARTYATLRIYHEDLDPASITRLLGVEPTHTQVKGRLCTSITGRTFNPEIGGWFLSTKVHVARWSPDLIGDRSTQVLVSWLAQAAEATSRGASNGSMDQEIPIDS